MSLHFNSGPKQQSGLGIKLNILMQLTKQNALLSLQHDSKSQSTEVMVGIRPPQMNGGRVNSPDISFRSPPSKVWTAQLSNVGRTSDNRCRMRRMTEVSLISKYWPSSVETMAFRFSNRHHPDSFKHKFVRRTTSLYKSSEIYILLQNTSSILKFFFFFFSSIITATLCKMFSLPSQVSTSLHWMHPW